METEITIGAISILVVRETFAYLKTRGNNGALKHLAGRIEQYLENQTELLREIKKETGEIRNDLRIGLERQAEMRRSIDQSK